MREEFGIALADLTTFRVGGPPKRLVVAETESDLIEAVTECDARDEPVLVLGGGSNLLVADDGFDGTVIRVASSGVSVDADGCEADDMASCGGLVVTVAAGENWDEIVARSISERWVGFEALSGIPGLVGATPMQNVGAYGQEVSRAAWNVRVYDRELHRIKTFANADCGFTYRDSVFKRTGRYVILDVSYQLLQGDLSAPIAYAELANALDVSVGERVPLADVRAAVLGLRSRKGMVLDADDHDTWSAGSFFTNPIVTKEEVARLPDGAPRWETSDGRVKLSAAWLIQNAGFDKGHAGPGGRVSLSTKHTLALTNRGDASAAEIVALAREVRNGVRATFGIELVNEPTLIGNSL